MKRRDLLKTAAVLPAIASAQQDAAPPDAVADPITHFFSTPQFAALVKLSDAILPRIGGTPGALDARVPEFLDFLIGRSSVEEQNLYRNGLDHAFDLSPLSEPWTYLEPRDPYARFLQRAKHDILTAAINSHEWIAAVAKRNPAVTGAGTYWLPIE